MKKINIAISLLCLLAACNSSSYKKAEDAQDAGREFIRASLDGNYDKASFYMLPDSTNNFLLQKWKTGYDQLSPEEKAKYKNADIIVLEVKPENDSLTDYKYFNSYKKDTTSVKVLRINGQWVVDLKEFMNTQK
ncbi:MAG: hypothetical protein JST58_13245 [Bacteroidetes bacterium]|nr:hypothetical protein [Bacteroidota bacterium]